MDNVVSISGVKVSLKQPINHSKIPTFRIFPIGTDNLIRMVALR